MSKKRFWWILMAAILLVQVLTVSAFATQEPSLDIQNKSISLDSAIYMNFKVAATNVPKEDISLLIWTTPTKPYVKGTEDTVLMSDGTDSKGREVFVYKDIDSRKMTDVIYARAYAVVNGKEIYSAPVRFSVKEYAYRIDRLQGQEKLKKLVYDMLQYGASAQQYFHYHEDFLATASVYEIKAEGATFADGLTSGIYMYGDTVTITADTPEPGYTFLHFADILGNIISVEKSITVTVDSDIQYCAVFAKGQQSSLRHAPLMDSAYANVAMDSAAPMTVPAVGVTDGAAAPLVIQSRSISLDSAIYMNFKVQVADIPKEKVSLLIWTEPQKQYIKGTENTVLLSEGTDGKGREVFVYQDIDSRKMTDVIYARAYAAVNGKEVYSEPVSFSVVEYVYSMNYATSDWTLRELLDTMLQYGKSAQIYFAYRTDTLAKDSFFKVSLENATLPDGMRQGMYKEGTTVTVTADVPQPGMIFSYFENVFGENLGSANPLIATAETLNTVKAVYKPIPGRSAVGLAYAVNADGKTCTLTGLGSCTDTELRIPEKWGKYTVTAIGNGAFAVGMPLTRALPMVTATAATATSKLTSVVIPDTVTTIGDNAFAGQNNLTGVVIPKSVTEVGKNAFADCTDLDSVYYEGTQEEWNSVKIDNTDSTLADATRYYDIPTGTPEGFSKGLDYQLNRDGKTYGITGLGACTDADIRIPETINGCPVTEISWHAFYERSAVKSLILPRTCTKIGEKAIERIFDLAIYVESRDAWDAMEIIWDNRSSFTYRLYVGGELVTEPWFPEGSTTVGNRFAHCSSITTVHIPEGMTVIGTDAFHECRNIETLYIPKTVTTIEESVFRYSDITYVYYAGTAENWANISMAGWVNFMNTGIMYYYADTQPNVAGDYWHDVNGTVTVWDKMPSEGLQYETLQWRKACRITGIGTCPDKNILIPEQINGYAVTEIGDFAFRDAMNIVRIEAPKSLKKVGQYAFCNTRMKSIVLHEGLTEIGDCAFIGSFVKSVVLPDGLKTIGSNVFDDCRLLQSVYIPDSLTTIGWSILNGTDANVHIDSMAFFDKNSLGMHLGAFRYGLYVQGLPVTEVTVTDMNATYSGCDTIEKAIIANGVQRLVSGTFSGCENLKTVVFPNTLNEIGYEVFKECDGLTSMVIPDTVSEIGIGAFERCYNLTSVKLPDSLSDIPNNIFSYCHNLESIVVPPTVKMIGDNAFMGCSSLRDVVMNDAVYYIGENAFADCRMLQHIEIPESILTIYSNSFIRCDNVQFTVYDTAKYLGNSANPYFIVMEPVDKQIVSCKIHPDAKVLSRDAFWHCDNLQTVSIPDGIRSVSGDNFKCTYQLQYAVSGNIKYLGNEQNPYLVAMGIQHMDSDQFEIHPDTRIIGNHAFVGSTIIKTAKIPNGIRYMGSNVFEGCSGLTNVTFSDSIQEIPISTFADCTGLVTVTLPDSVKKINRDAFKNCTGLTKIESGNGVVRIEDSAFSGCTSLTAPFFPPNLETLGDYVFENSGVISVTIPKHIQNIGTRTFANCQKLKTVTAENGVTTLGYSIFNSCNNLTTVILPDTLNNLGLYTFSYCTGLQAIHVPGKVTEIFSGTFQDCENLTEIHIPDSVKTIGDYAFDGCIHIDKVYIDSLDQWLHTEFGIQGNPLHLGAKLYVGGNLFTHLTLPSGIQTVGDAFQGCQSISNVTIPSGVTGIAGYAFAYCQNLQSVSIPASVQHIETGAFTGCPAIDNVYIEDVDRWILMELRDGASPMQNGASLYVNGFAMTDLNWPMDVQTVNTNFRGCESLRHVTIPEGVTQIAMYAFQSCTNLESVAVPDSVEAIGESAFSSCSKLASFAVPKGIKIIEAATFWGCKALKRIEIPSGVTRIAPQAFYNCETLQTCILPDGIESIGPHAFTNCPKLDYTVLNAAKYLGSASNPYLVLMEMIAKNDTSYTIHKNTKMIGYRAFAGCNNVREISIPFGVKRIDEQAFSGCRNLTTVNLARSVTYIGGGAFMNSNMLDAVYYTGSAADWRQVHNSGLSSNYVYCYSVKQPTETGNYWHFVNGKPAKW